MTRVAQSGAETPWIRLGYLATFALILCYRKIPWADLILRCHQVSGWFFRLSKGF